MTVGNLVGNSLTTATFEMTGQLAKLTIKLMMV